MECPKCHHQNPTEAKFCLECGAKLELLCPKCGIKLPSGSRFCMECGTKITTEEPIIPKLEEMHEHLQSFIPESLSQRMYTASMETEGENRLITALFADISGFSALSNQNSPEQAVNIVNQCFKAIVDAVYNYEGSVNRFIGDNVLAFFGAPIAHENDSERALLAALEMRESVQKLNLNISIGINTGFMYVGKIGVDKHIEYSAYGIEINLAKRLQEVASAGRILVGPGTYRFIRKAFEFQAVQLTNLKGIDSPITAYELMRQLETPQKLRGIEGLKSQFVGREKEFIAISECTESWLSGKGQVVSVIGEAGIGKSRLVSEMTKDLRLKVEDSEDDDYQSSIIMEGRCLSIGQPISYWPFLDILRNYFDLKQDDSEHEIANKITGSIKTLFPVRYEEFLPYFGYLFSVKFRNDLDNRLDILTPEQVHHLTMMRLRDTFVTISQQKPLMLILEDLHWADNLSMDLLSLLMDALTSTQLMLVCVYRPEKEHRCYQLPNIASRKCPDLLTEIILKQLTTQGSRRMVESLLDIDNLPEQLKQIILEKSEGNPFFIEEMIRSMIERDLVYQDGDHWKARQEIENLNVPDTIQGLLLERIDRLKTEVKYILQCASVIGRLFQYRLLDHITKYAGKVDSYIGQLEQRDLVYEERSIPELEYAFKHVLTQEATYQGMLENQRKAFHYQVAQSIESLYKDRIEDYYEQLAYHYRQSNDHNKALDYILKSADKAKKQYANEEAIGFYHQALKVLEESGEEADPIRTEAYYESGRIYQMISKGEKAKEAYLKALEYCKNRRKRSRIYMGLDGVDDSAGYINKAIESLGDDTSSPEMALIYCSMASQLWHNKSDQKGALEALNNGLNIVIGTENYEEIIALCEAAMWFYNFLWNNDLLKYYSKVAYESAERSGNPRLKSDAMLVITKHDNYENYDVIMDSINMNRRIGNWDQVIHGYCCLFWHYNYKINKEKELSALQDGYDIIRMIEKSGDKTPFWKEWFEYVIALVYIELNPDEVERWFNEVAPKPIQDKNREFIIKTYIAIACWNKNDYDRAKSIIAQAVSILKEVPTDFDSFDNVAQKHGIWLSLGHLIDKRLFPEETLFIAETVFRYEDRLIPEAKIMLGNAYVMNGQYEKALEFFIKAYSAVPKHCLDARYRNFEFYIELAQKAPHLGGLNELFGLMREKIIDEESLEEFRKIINEWEEAKRKLS